MSGHTLKTPVVLICACWWLSLVWLGACASRLRSWRWCLSLACWFRVSFCVSPCEGRREDPLYSAAIPLDDLGLQLPASEAPRVGGPLVVSVVTDQMVGDRRSPGRQYWGASSCTSSANHRMPGSPGSVLRDRSCCGQCTRWLVQNFQTGAALRRHFSRAVAAAATFVSVVAATSAWCRGTRQRNIAVPIFPPFPTLRRCASHAGERVRYERHQHRFFGPEQVMNNHFVRNIERLTVPDKAERESYGGIVQIQTVAEMLTNASRPDCVAQVCGKAVSGIGSLHAYLMSVR